MTPGCPESRPCRTEADRCDRAPVLVLGLGNVLLGDDGVGPRLLEAIRHDDERDGSAASFVDGGTLGLNLIGQLAGRRAVLILDAVARGAEAGAVHALLGDEALAAPPPATTAHEGNAGDLLRAALLLGELPPAVAVVGIEPERVATGIGLSPRIEAALETAVEAARGILAAWARGARSPGGRAAGEGPTAERGLLSS